MNSWLFLSLILAHVIGDFYLQNDKYCAQKEERKFKSWFLYVHSLIIGVVSWVVVPVYEFRFYALAIAFSHLVIDVIKTYSPKGLWNFVIDQVAHLAILIIVIFSFDTTTKVANPNRWIAMAATLYLYSYWLYYCASSCKHPD